MASMQKLSFLAGSAAIAAALVGMAPAQAEDTTPSMVDSANVIEADVDMLAEQEAAATATDLDMTAQAETREPIAAEVPLAVADTSEALVLDDTVATSSDALLAVEPGVDGGITPGQQIAQETRPLYQGVTPFYVGVGGNIGIIESSESATGDFGFSVISKVSLGPRFALRPSLVITEKRTSLTVPLTYNFSPIEVGGVNVHPFLGAGIDVPFDQEVGLLINGGVDIPISRQFTLNAQTNWRVTSDFGLGLTIGVGYNFPIFFE